MNCVENLKSKREIQIKLKQFFSTNDWVSLKSSPYSNGSCSWLKDMARTEHLYLSLVCRSDEAALKTSLIQPYSPCLKRHKKKLYHRSGVVRKSWSSERSLCKNERNWFTWFIHHQCIYQWPLFSLHTRSFQPNMTALHVGQRNQGSLERFPNQSQRVMGELKDSTINLKAFSQKFCGLIGFANPSLFNNKSERFLFEQQTELSIGVPA